MLESVYDHDGFNHDNFFFMFKFTNTQSKLLLAGLTRPFVRLSSTFLRVFVSFPLRQVYSRANN